MWSTALIPFARGCQRFWFYFNFDLPSCHFEAVQICALLRWMLSSLVGIYTLLNPGCRLKSKDLFFNLD